MISVPLAQALCFCIVCLKSGCITNVTVVHLDTCTVSRLLMLPENVWFFSSLSQPHFPWIVWCIPPFPPICVSRVRNGFVLSGYDYLCHTNLENICVHISTYLRTHAGVSRDMEEEDTQSRNMQKHTHTHRQIHVQTHALCSKYRHSIIEIMYFHLICRCCTVEWLLSMKGGGTAGSIVNIHSIVLDKGSLSPNYLFKIFASTNTLMQPWLMINEHWSIYFVQKGG